MPMQFNGTSGLTFPDSSTQATAALTGFRNRIINGDMRIDQRNAGASVTPAQDAFAVDRWKWGQSQSSKFTSQQSSTAPAGFTNSLMLTVASAVTVGASDYFSVYQPVEGFNVSDLGWGTASAQAITLSFKVRSSLTGTFGGSVRNSAGNRSYPFTFNISSANTFEDKTITIPGDTSGTWLTNSGVGLFLNFGLGVGATLSGTAGAWAGVNYLSASGATSVVGTNGATFYITGVQLEAGSVATPFERRPYGVELALCQRYCWVYGYSDNAIFGAGFETSSDGKVVAAFPATMRASPTMNSSGAAAFSLVDAGSTGRVGTAIALHFSSPSSASVSLSAAGTTGNAACFMRTAGASAFIAFSAEL